MRRIANLCLAALAAVVLVGPSGAVGTSAQMPSKPDVIAAEQERSTYSVASRSLERLDCLAERCARPTPAPKPSPSVAPTQPAAPKSCTKIKNSIWKGPCPPKPSRDELTRIAREVLAERGWDTDAQWNCLDQLVYKESGWNVYSENSIHAYGLPQAYPGSKMAKAGADWGYNPRTQLRWMMGYIAGIARYRTPCGAWERWNRQYDANGHHWY